MKNSLKKYWWIILILLIGFILFYWFQLRPGQIRKGCSVVASELSPQYNINEHLQQLKEGVYFNETLYQKCLREHGINK